ncbi:sensor histidine kinase [Pseudoduganella aquatica]|uniref:sensor histidine kinase n=1 Tax=Pseudoduganella aquatica TaxID=2660641 RepID=UPI001E28C59A|nr:HAMP domain-containing sensor histidine kinase [Pseudoduganella aquatica]
MLHTFLSDSRSDLIERCKAKVLQRQAPSVTQVQLEYGIPLFLDQLIRTLQAEQGDGQAESLRISGPAGGALSASEIGLTAAQHGKELLTLGFTVNEAVHTYGDLCQAITDLAVESGTPFEVDEFRTLNRCLDNAIADAVTEFSRQRESDISDQHTSDANKRLGYLAHEARNMLGTALLAHTALRSGNLSLQGATSTILERSLHGLAGLIDGALDEIRVLHQQTEAAPVFALDEFISEVHGTAELTARSRGCTLVASPVQAGLAIAGNRALLLAAVANLLQNAFKFSPPHSQVTLLAMAAGERILIEVHDHCGGLPAGAAASMFQPFSQHGKDRSGLGLGLTIAQNAVIASGGTLSVRDVPGTGCVFTVNLPRCSLPG